MSEEQRLAAEAETTPLVQLRDVRKCFGDEPALERITLDIHAGQFVTLLGASGCGKTTLLRLLAGFERPTSGQILLSGVDQVDIPPHRRNINMMFQSYALFPHMTVEKNIGFGLRQEHVSREEIADRVAEMLKLIQMERFAHRKPDQLSGGQSQRVALARALIKKPRLLLLDEPLAALDKKLRLETQFELVDIQESLGLTFIMVTHDQEEAMTMAEEIVVMRNGRIEQQGSPYQIYEYPQSAYVADFIGEANLFRGGVRTEAGRPALEWHSDLPPIPLLENISGKAILAVRPEKIALTTEAPAPCDGQYVLRGVVNDIRYSGNSSMYHIRAGDRIFKATESNSVHHSQNPQGGRFVWEQEVWMHWPIDAVRLLEHEPCNAE